MTRVFLLAAALVASAGLSFAQECPGAKGECAGGSCDAPCQGKAQETTSLAAKIAALDAKAAKGCQTSKDLLAKLYKIANVESTETLTQVVTTCEESAGAGCDASAKILKEIDAAFAAAQPKTVALSARIAKLDQYCAAGCKTSKETLQALVAEYKVENGKALVALVQSWESMAAKGCPQSAEKLTALAAKLPSEKPALSVQVAKLSEGCAHGCEQSKTQLAALLKEFDAADGKTLVAKVQSWESMAAKGCPESKSKLASLEAKLAGVPAAKPTAAQAKKAECGDCEDCEDCEECEKCCEDEDECCPEAEQPTQG